MFAVIDTRTASRMVQGLSSGFRLLNLKDYLVGVELNPGPAKKSKKVAAAMQKVVKKVKNLPQQQRQSALQKALAYAPDVGATIGGVLGPVGAKVGGGLGTLVNKIFGSGSYEVNGNTLMGGQVPSFNSNDKQTVISHREYLGDISGTTNFTLAAYSVNPGLASSFPWLSSVARNYEQYEMLGLIYEYRPMSGTAVGSTNTALGTVVMATDYDVANPNFINKQQMESYEFSCSDVPFNKIIHPVECKPTEKTIAVQYIRTGPVPAGDDPQFYDLGNFQIATQGMQSGVSTIGELWVSYHVRLLKPRIDVSGSSTQYVHIRAGPFGSATAAAPLGTSGGTMSTLSNLSGVSAGTNTIVIQGIGNYYLHAAFWGTAITVAPSLSGGSNISALLIMDDYSNSFTGSVLASNYGLFTYMFSVTASGTGAANTITIGGNTGLTAGNSDVFIVQMPYGIAASNI